MGSYSRSCEIVEAREEMNSATLSLGGNHGGPPGVKLGEISSVKDDINQLFEGIRLKNFSKGFDLSNQASTSTSSSLLRKNAMNRPVSVGSPRIGVSDQLSLKQALRDLCISKASEMAAMKRLSKSGASPRVSEAGRIKSLYNSVVVESRSGQQHPVDENKGTLVEISLAPEETKSNSSENVRDVKSSNPSSRSSHNSQVITSPGDSALSDSADNILDEDTFAASSSKVARKAPGLRSGRRGRPSSHPSRSIIVSKVSKFARKNKNSVKKKTKQDSSSASNIPNEGHNSLASSTGQLLCHKCQCALRNVNADSSQDISGNFSAEISPGNVDSCANNPNLSSSNCNLSSSIRKAKRKSESREKGEFSQSSKSSLVEYSTSTSNSDESNASRPSCCNRPHMSKDIRWEAIRRVKIQDKVLSLRHFNILKKLGCGDIGTVYLAELIGSGCLFAIKVMDNEYLARRKKIPRAQTEREILRMLDHPFLPTLYAQFTSDNLSCLVMEYCPGGDLHVLRQKQLGGCFSEPAARFYVAEVLLALEYLHMLGVIYRDLKPENILVREDGHIMLSDFDLSLRCTVNPTLLKSNDPSPVKMPGPNTKSSCIEPFCIEPSCQVPCFSPRILPSAVKARKLKAEMAINAKSLPQLVAEPTDARSNSFVGTHEYLAPEIIIGNGHGAAVDWWTFGIFLYELLYGRTPFKGSCNEETLENVVSQNLQFPNYPHVSFQARDLIWSLLSKDPENRLGTEKGAAEIKQHPFFEGLNWALIRCAIPPELPDYFGVPHVSSGETSSKYLEYESTEEHLEFELF